MSDDARRRILDRRARFVAAAMALGATTGVAACEPQVCLEAAIDCDADTRRLQVVAPSNVCVGEPVSLVAVSAGSCESDTVTSQAVFATSDPELLVIDGASARALKPGTVLVSALFNGQEAKAAIVIRGCTDAGSEDAADAD